MRQSDTLAPHRLLDLPPLATHWARSGTFLQVYQDTGNTLKLILPLLLQLDGLLSQDSQGPQLDGSVFFNPWRL